MVVLLGDHPGYLETQRCSLLVSARLGRYLRCRTRWTPPGRCEISSAESGGVARADSQQPGNGAIAFANDNDLSTYWYAGDNRPHGKLTIDLAKAEPVSSIRFLRFRNRHVMRRRTIASA